MKLTFIGATLGVTGSKTLLECDDGLFLIDAGLYQEGEHISTLNKEELPFSPKKLTAIIITHAHLDHSGFLPYLYQQGFRGGIYLTEATSKLTRIILSDSAELMNKEDSPIYSLEDAHNVVSLFRPQKFSQEFSIKNTKVTFHHAAHILGAAFVEIKVSDKTIVFSGDLGRGDDPILAPPDNLVAVDYLILESTYGAKNRSSDDMQGEMLNILRKVHKEKLNLIVPCFALHRAQMLSYLIKEIFTLHPELKMPLFLNSPMMEEVTKVYHQFQNDFKVQFDKFNFWSELYFLNGYWDIDRVNKAEGPQVILASSGMITGGRIWTHLIELAPKNDSLIFFPGYLAANTLGHQMANGEKNLISPDGIEFNVKAEVIQSDVFSSHAKQDELIAWVHSTHKLPSKIFLNHGEEQSKLELAKKLQHDQMEIVIPRKYESFNLS